MKKTDIAIVSPTVSGVYTDRQGQHSLQFWNGQSSSYNYVCNSYNANTTMQVPLGSSVSWQRISASQPALSWSQSGNNINFYFWAVNQTEVFRINVISICGTKSFDFGFKSINCSGGGGGGGGGGGCLQFAISPNPSYGILNVVVPNIPAPCDVVTAAPEGNKAIQQKHVITQINIYDNLGNIKKSIPVKKAKQATVNLSGLTPGIYYVEIKDGAYSERQKVVLQE